MSGDNSHEIVECPLCGSDHAGVPRFKANAFLSQGHGVDDVILLKKAATKFAVNVEPSNDWSDAYFFRILRDVLRASVATPPVTEMVPEGTTEALEKISSQAAAAALSTGESEALCMLSNCGLLADAALAKIHTTQKETPNGQG